MSARFASLSQGVQAALAGAVLLLVVLIGYFAVISPKRSTSADLKQQTAAVQAQIDRNKSSAFSQALPAVRSATVFNLAQAMPSELETPNLVLQLNQLAQDSGISFDDIEPGVPGVNATVANPTDPFAAEPIKVQFSGSFYNLLAFLQRVRNLVRVENGRLFTAGRLYDVTDVDFEAGPNGFPQIQATLNISAFVPQTPVAAITPGVTDTTATTTTGTTTTTSNPTSAAPSATGGTS